jgi:hypothetical protein
VLQVCSEDGRVETGLDIVKPRGLPPRGHGVQAVKSQTDEAVNAGVACECGRDSLGGFYGLAVDRKAANGDLRTPSAPAPHMYLGLGGSLGERGNGFVHKSEEAEKGLPCRCRHYRWKSFRRRTRWTTNSPTSGPKCCLNQACRWFVR